jgi:mediator of RNA polymerase II transcription subunit 14
VSGPGLRAHSLVSYDPKTSIVSFLSSHVDVAIDELRGEWDRVQKTLAIARHVSNMTRLKGYEDVRLLSFNLLTIEFTYQSVSQPLLACCAHGFYMRQDFVATIEYIPPTLVLRSGHVPTGTFQVSFSQLPPDASKSARVTSGCLPNPHQEIASYLSPRLVEGNSEQTRQAMQEFVLVRFSAVVHSGGTDHFITSASSVHASSPTGA